MFVMCPVETDVELSQMDMPRVEKFIVPFQLPGGEAKSIKVESRGDIVFVTGDTYQFKETLILLGGQFSKRSRSKPGCWKVTGQSARGVYDALYGQVYPPVSPAPLVAQPLQPPCSGYAAVVQTFAASVEQRVSKWTTSVRQNLVALEQELGVFTTSVEEHLSVQQELVLAKHQLFNTPEGVLSVFRELQNCRAQLECEHVRAELGHFFQMLPMEIADAVVKKHGERVERKRKADAQQLEFLKKQNKHEKQ